jgi:hypothetical protein
MASLHRQQRGFPNFNLPERQCLKGNERRSGQIKI